MLYKTKTISKCDIFSANEKIGEADDVLFDDFFWTVRYVIVRTGNFLNRKNVLLSPIGIQKIDIDDKEIYLNLTKQQLEESPDIDTDKPVSRQHESELFRYYGWPKYWSRGLSLRGGWVVGPYGILDSDTQNIDTDTSELHGTEENYDYHLRSAKEIEQYSIKALDDDFGHVEEFLIDGNHWTINYVAIDKINWMPSGSTLIPVRLIRDISWDEKSINVPVIKEVIKGAPNYDADNLTETVEKDVDEYYDFHIKDKQTRPDIQKDNQSSAVF